MIQDEDMLLLESDGIKLIDFDKQMKQIDQLEDLRMSIGVNSNPSNDL